MVVDIIYNTPNFIPIGILIPIYFYITGLHAGFYTTSVMATLIGIKEWKPIGKIGAAGAVIILTIAPIFLLIDLGRPLRFWHLFVYLNPTSPITWGTFFLTTYPIIGLVYAWNVFRGNQKAAKIWGLVGFPIAISVHGYTGFILALGKARVLWNTSLNPILFLVSAMVSGLALIILVANIRLRYFTSRSTSQEREGDKRVINTLILYLIIFIIVDLFLIGSDLAVLATHSRDAYYSLLLLIVGPWALWFLGVEIFLGEIIPLAMLSFRKIRLAAWGQNIASILILIGIFVMRIIIVVGGQNVPLH